MPAKRVIVLEKTDANHYNFVLWADVPAARQSFYANPTATSAWKGAAAGDITAIQQGQVAERAGVWGRSPGATLAQAESDLQLAWQSFQDEVTNNNPWQRYGTFWDGTTWTAGGVS